MEAFFRGLLRFSKFHLLLLAVVTGYLGSWALRVGLNFSLEQLLATEPEDLEVYRRFREHHGREDLTLYVAFRVEDVFAPETRARIRGAADLLRGLPHVASVRSIEDIIRAAGFSRLAPDDVRRQVLTSPIARGLFVDAEGRTTVIVLELQEECTRQEVREPALEAVRAALAKVEGLLGVPVHLAGIPTIENEYIRLMERDLLTFMPITLGVFLILHAWYFRSVVGTLLPLAAVVAGDLWLVGGMALTGTPISVLTTIVPNLVLVIGISEGIHILSRYQEDLAALPVRREALARTMRVMLWPCFLTCFTSAVGFASLGVADNPVVREFALLSGIGIMLAYVAVVQVIPTVLDNAPPLRANRPSEVAARFSGRVLSWIARAVDRRRGLTALVTLGVLAAAGAGIPRIRENASWLQDIAADNPVYRDHEFIEQNLASIFTVELSLEAARPGGFATLETLRELEALEEKFRADPDVASVVGWSDLVREMMSLTGGERRLPSSPLGLAAVQAQIGLAVDRDLRRMVVDDRFTHARISVRATRRLEATGLVALVGRIRAMHEAAAPAFSLRPTGKSWLAKRSLDRVIHAMGSTLQLSAAVISLSMALMFGSLRTGLISMVPNFLPMVVTAGLMGYLKIDLNFTTVTVFSISLGLAVENTIQFLVRYRQEFAADGVHAAAVERTLLSVGRPMVFSTMLLILGFGAILTSNFKFTFYFGLLGGVTMLAALAADLFVLPLLLLVFKPKVRTLREFLARWKSVVK